MRSSDEMPRSTGHTAPDQLESRLHRDSDALAKTRDDAADMRETAIDMRMRMWLDRLAVDRRTGSRPAMLRRGLEAAVSVAAADYGNIQLLDPGGHGLTLGAQQGFEAGFLDELASVTDGSSACGLALELGHNVAVDDVATSALFAETQARDVFLDAGVRAVSSTAMVTRDGRMLGALSIHHRAPHVHGRPELARMQTLANAICASIDLAADGAR